MTIWFFGYYGKQEQKSAKMSVVHDWIEVPKSDNVLFSCPINFFRECQVRWELITGIKTDNA